MNSDLKIKALRVVVSDGIKTILAVIDRDKRFLSQLSSSMLNAIGDANLAYGYNEQQMKFIPSPKQIEIAEHVERWLVWLRAYLTRRDVSRLFAWARGTPLWRLAQIENCHERTINNRIDRSMAAILNQFFDQEITIEQINAPIGKMVFSFQTEKSFASNTKLIDRYQRCWIDEVGFMKEGKRISDGHHKAEKTALYRGRAR